MKAPDWVDRILDMDRIFGSVPPPREQQRRPPPRPLSTFLADDFDRFNCWLANQLAAHARGWQAYRLSRADELKSTQLRPRFEKDQAPASAAACEAESPADGG